VNVLEHFANFKQSVEQYLNNAATTPGDWLALSEFIFLSLNGLQKTFNKYWSSSGLDNFQDFRVFHFFEKTLEGTVNGRTVTKVVGSIQCKADFLDRGDFFNCLLLVLIVLPCQSSFSLSLPPLSLQQTNSVFHDTRNDPNKCIPLCKDPMQTFTWSNFYSKNNKMKPYIIDCAPIETLQKLQECLDACKNRIYRTRCNHFFCTLNSISVLSCMSFWERIQCVCFQIKWWCYNWRAATANRRF
jgi:hypothetical protein